MGEKDYEWCEEERETTEVLTRRSSMALFGFPFFFGKKKIINKRGSNNRNGSQRCNGPTSESGDTKSRMGSNKVTGEYDWLMYAIAQAWKSSVGRNRALRVSRVGRTN